MPTKKRSERPATKSAQTVKSPRDLPRAGGETHQVANGVSDRLTTAQGVPVTDDQNTLRAGDRGPALQQQADDEIAAINAEWDAVAGAIDTVTIPLEKSDIRISDLSLVWVPTN